MRETDEMQGRPKKKKGQFGNAKHRICTTNYLRTVLTMRVDKFIVAEALFLVLAQLILASASTFALSLTVKIIVPSFVSQAILSNFSGRLFCRLCFDSDATIMRECSENSGLQMHRSWLWENV